MNQKDKRKKAIERFYVEAWLKMSRSRYGIVTDCREEPDFLLTTPKGFVGLEVINLYKDEGEYGSPHKGREQRRDQTLRKLSAAYYREGGLPAKITAILPCPVDDSWIPKLVKRFRMARSRVVWRQRRFQIKLGGSPPENSAAFLLSSNYLTN